MSYEILLYPRTPGQDWVEVLEADEVDGPEMDLATLNQGVARFRRIEARLREQLTEPVRTWVAEELDGDVLGELQTKDSRLRVDLYDRSALVSAPYGGPGAAVHDLVRQAVEIVAAETGYEAYDPQVGSTFDGSFDDEAGQASLSRVPDQDDLWAEEAPSHIDGEMRPTDAATASALEGQVVDDGDQDGPLDPRAERARLIQERRQQLLEQRRNPAALRRRGWFYVLLGVIFTAIGLMRLSAGESAVLTWLFLGVGVFELIGAWLLFSQARQADPHQGQQSSGSGQSADTVDDGPDEGPDDTVQR
ncbi:hypothetical protein [Ornithinimicrobium cryptoxanthini]|uniref:Uncharacterized protein n=1 Tax=Ornithinimicrobium cryptoxanthini TaxID=2934161 RepID=A0ABY4YKL7_9MICO|nr:hypothetical protein [Ornithinimicrobium cryptoxanthini]USQ77351.1 hypothetical protein NF557_05410 [Ornithinimicrobium cryptoxanthini]